MRTQFVELLDDTALDRSAFGPSRYDENSILACWDWYSCANTPSDA
jgi:hypothetical protein